MGFFTRRQTSALPAGVEGALPDYGAAFLKTRSGRQGDAEFGWSFIGPVVSALNGSDQDRAIQELYDAALAADQPLAIVGAHGLLSEWNPGSRDDRCLELQDAFLAYLRRKGYSSGNLNRHEADRWIELHGDLRSSFDAITEVDVPSAAEKVPVDELEPGTHKLMAQLAPMPPLPQGNRFYIERRLDGSYVLFSERWSDESKALMRCDEDDYGSSFVSIVDALRVLGRMLQLKPAWADPALEPYFTLQRK